MKKIVVVSIVIAVFAAVFAVLAVQTDFFKSSEAVKPVVEQKHDTNIEKNVKILPKTMKLQKIKVLDKEKLKEAVKKMKENRDKDPDFKKKHESCGE